MLKRPVLLHGKEKILYFSRFALEHHAGRSGEIHIMHRDAVTRERNKQLAAGHGNLDVFAGYKPHERQRRHDAAAARTAGESEVLNAALVGDGLYLVFSCKPDKADVRALGEGRRVSECLAKLVQLILRCL